MKRKYLISEICKTISETYKGNDSQVILVNTSDVFNGDVLNHTAVENKSLKGQFKKTFKKNDILYSEIRPANKRFAFIDFDDTSNYIASTKLMVIRANEDIVLPRFLFYILTNEELLNHLQYLAETRSGTFPQITFSSELGPIEVEVPSLEEQKKIVNLLDSILKKIAINSSISKLLEEQSSILVKELIKTNECHSVRLLDFSMVKYGKGLPKNKLKPSGYPVFGGNGIIGYYDKYMYENPQILISCRGAASGKILESLPRSFVTSNSLVIELSDNFYYYFYRKYFMDNQLFQYATGSAQPQITIDNLKNVYVPQPSKESLKQINDLLKTSAFVVLNNYFENEKLEELKNTIIPRLLSGEYGLE